VLSDTQFSDIFLTANRTAWKKLLDDPLLCLTELKHEPSLRLHVAQLIQHCDELAKKGVLYNELKENFTRRALAANSDRECLMIDMNSLKLSNEASQDFVNFVNMFILPCDVVLRTLLYSCWLRKILMELINGVSSISLDNVQVSSSRLTSPLNDIDQNVLFYVSGYLAMKVQNASFRFKKMFGLRALTKCLATKEPQLHNNFVDQYKQWVATTAAFHVI
jgi:hypothetical protein